MKRVLEAVCSNKKLQYINLSWNNLVDERYTEKEQNEIQSILAVALKRNKELLHIDLSSTGLTGMMLKSIGTCLRRSTSLLSIHLSDNPGLTEEICDYLVQRIRCRPREDMDRFKRIQELVNKDPQT